jgi:hypothetical protein
MSWHLQCNENSKGLKQPAVYSEITHFYETIFILMIPPLFDKQEVGIWRVKKRFPRYGVPIWSLWPNITFYTHWTYMHIFLSNYWWQRSDILSQASYRYPISWEAFFDPSDSYFLFAEERGYHKWALAHSSSCCV